MSAITWALDVLATSSEYDLSAEIAAARAEQYALMDALRAIATMNTTRAEYLQEIAQDALAAAGGERGPT